MENKKKEVIIDGCYVEEEENKEQQVNVVPHARLEDVFFTQISPEAKPFFHFSRQWLVQKASDMSNQLESAASRKHR